MKSKEQRKQESEEAEEYANGFDPEVTPVRHCFDKDGICKYCGLPKAVAGAVCHPEDF